MNAKKKPAPKAKKPVPRKRCRCKVGSTTVVIQRLKDGRAALVTYTPGAAPGTRKREKTEYATLGEAQTAFTLRERELERAGSQAAAIIEDADRLAVADFKTTTADWSPAPSVAEALAFYVSHKKSIASSGTLGSAIDRRLTDAIHRGLSPRHREDLDLRLAKLKSALGDRPLAGITGDDLKQWLAGLGVSPATQRNYLKIAGSVFALAIDEGRISSNPALKVRLAKVVGDEPGILPAEHLGKLLAALPLRSLAAFAIQAFAGVRRAEAGRLKWDDVKIDQGFIVIGAQAAKTASRRLIPISPALRAWLDLCPEQKGLVAPPVGTLRFDLDAAREAAGITEWPQNCLRHSCLTAWAAVESDLAKVAGWAGHAVAVLHAHYRALQTREQGEEWHSTYPPGHKPAKKPPSHTKTTHPRKATAKPEPTKTTRTAPAEAAPVEPLAEVIPFPKAAAS